MTKIDSRAAGAGGPFAEWSGVTGTFIATAPDTNRVRSGAQAYARLDLSPHERDTMLAALIDAEEALDEAARHIGLAIFAPALRNVRTAIAMCEDPHNRTSPLRCWGMK